MQKTYRGAKFQNFGQQVAITTNAALTGYYSAPITLDIPDGYTPVGIQWIDDWTNMVIPLFRFYSTSNVIHLYFMCPSSVTANLNFRVIYMPKD